MIRMFRVINRALPSPQDFLVLSPSRGQRRWAHVHLSKAAICCMPCLMKAGQQRAGVLSRFKSGA
jgi:hypothetical protein